MKLIPGLEREIPGKNVSNRRLSSSPFLPFFLRVTEMYATACHYLIVDDACS